MRWLDRINDAMDMNLEKLQEMMRDMEARCAVVHEVTERQDWRLNKTDFNFHFFIYYYFLQNNSWYKGQAEVSGIELSAVLTMWERLKIEL